MIETCGPLTAANLFWSAMKLLSVCLFLRSPFLFFLLTDDGTIVRPTDRPTVQPTERASERLFSERERPALNCDINPSTYTCLFIGGWLRPRRKLAGSLSDGCPSVKQRSVRVRKNYRRRSAARCGDKRTHRLKIRNEIASVINFLRFRSGPSLASSAPSAPFFELLFARGDQSALVVKSVFSFRDPLAFVSGSEINTIVETIHDDMAMPRQRANTADTSVTTAVAVAA